MSHRNPFGHADGGFTLIEALVVLTIAAVAIAMAPLALSMGQASFRVAADVERHTSGHRALAALSDRIGSARPLFETRANGLAALAFDGASDRLRFVTEFADGPAGGGLYSVELARDPLNSSVVLRLQPFSSEADPPHSSIVVTVLPAQRLELRYFSNDTQTDAAAWRPDWLNGSQLPDLVELKVVPVSEETALPSRIIAMRLAR